MVRKAFSCPQNFCFMLLSTYKMCHWCWKILVMVLSCSDIPMAQFIINYNASLPASQKFIIQVLDSTHLFVQPHMAEMIRSAIAEFRDQNSYEKPNWFFLFFFYFSYFLIYYCPSVNIFCKLWWACIIITCATYMSSHIILLLLSVAYELHKSYCSLCLSDVLTFGKTLMDLNVLSA